MRGPAATARGGIALRKIFEPFEYRQQVRVTPAFAPTLVAPGIVFRRIAANKQVSVYGTAAPNDPAARPLSPLTVELHLRLGQVAPGPTVIVQNFCHQGRDM